MLAGLLGVGCCDGFKSGLERVIFYGEVLSLDD